MADPDATVILAEGDVEDPVQRVLDPPVAADDLGERRSIRRETGEVVACLNRDRVADPPGRLDADDTLQFGPGLIGIDVGEMSRVTDGAAAPVLDAPMAGVDGRGPDEIAQQRRATGPISLDEGLHNSVVQF